ncbi:hypothetical protein ScPMuIL_015192 [Solemya velum]
MGSLLGFEDQLQTVLKGEILPIFEVDIKRLKVKDDKFVPKTKSTVGYIVCGLALDEGDRVLMMQEAKLSCRGKWYLPAGRLERHENLLDGVKREVKEETGLEFDPATLISVEIQGATWMRFNFIGGIDGGKLKTEKDADEESLQANWFKSSQLQCMPNIRAKDIFPIIDTGEQYSKRQRAERHPDCLPALCAHSQLLHRQVIVCRDRNGRLHVLTNLRNGGHLPSSVITRNGVPLSDTEKLILTDAFGETGKGLTRKNFGLLSLEHCGRPPGGHDGMCFTTLVELNADSAPPVVCNQDYEWYVLDSGELELQLADRLRDGIQKVKIPDCQLAELTVRMNPQYSYYGPENYQYVPYGDGQVTFNYTQGQPMYPPQYEYEFEAPHYPTTSYVGFEPEYYQTGYDGMQTNSRHYSDSQSSRYHNQYEDTDNNPEHPQENKGRYKTERNSERSQEYQSGGNAPTCPDQRGSAPHYMASRHYRNKTRQPGGYSSSKVATGSTAKSATVRSAEVHVDRSVPPQPVEVSVKLGQDDDVTDDVKTENTGIQNYNDPNRSKQSGRYTGSEFTTRRKNNNFGRNSEGLGSGRQNKYRYKSDYSEETAAAPRGGYRVDYKPEYSNERSFSGRGARSRDYRTRQYRGAENYGNSTTFEGQNTNQKVNNMSKKPETSSDLSSAVDNYLGRRDTKDRANVDSSNSSRGVPHSARDDVRVNFPNSRSNDRAGWSNYDNRTRYRNSNQSKLSESAMNMMRSKDRDQGPVDEIPSKTDPYRDKSGRSTQTHKQPRQQTRVLPRTMSGNVDESQRGVLIEQLTLGSYECMVCCDTVRGQAAVWSCIGCFHVFHLRCIKKWARSPAAIINADSTGWRCPACQNVTQKVPSQYRCFCGKVRDPDWNRMDTPHSCGDVCSKARINDCPHPCSLLCHPGPCPPCSAMATKSCDCGKTRQTVKCGQSDTVKCDKVCDHDLNCGKHRCRAVCHSGSCDKCEQVFKQVCYCEKVEREVVCGSGESFKESYTCGQICNRFLKCGNHSCVKVCHPGDCDLCELLPSLITHCPCGNTPLCDLTSDPRTSCTDPVPTCEKRCNKVLSCGPKEDHHRCQQLCHESECGPCDGEMELTCRCGRLEKEFTCVEAQQFSDDEPFVCDRRCNKKRTCGRHKCGQTCCVNTEHPCDQICGKKLPCGLHKCEEACHRGNCPPCLMASFDELTCHCGAEVMFPPIPCGTKPPECHQLCVRPHSCQHQVRHQCHSDDRCPPCTELTQKHCMGGHELRKNIPCHIVDITCGLPCNKQLPCGQHKCQKTCHKGPCLEEGICCRQACTEKREECDHICGAPCHTGQPCPPVSCKAEIAIKCPCGRRKTKVPCLTGGISPPDITEMQKLTMQNLASSLQDLASGQTVDISQISGPRKITKKQLECDSDCAIEERNKRVALALEIRNPDLNGKLGNPSYTDFLKDFAKKTPSIVMSTEKMFSDLVQSARKSKQNHRSHAFPSMNRDQRRMVHELAEFYGCETQSYDYEPNKNVVATAHKDKCWLPSVTLTECVHREMHGPKAPPPIPHLQQNGGMRKLGQISKQSKRTMGSSDTDEKKTVWGTPLLPSPRTVLEAPHIKSTISDTPPSTGSKGSEKSEPVIDYFDFSTS